MLLRVTQFSRFEKPAFQGETPWPKTKMARGPAQKGGNPPRRHAISQGHASGSPRGRPRGSKNLAAYLIEAGPATLKPPRSVRWEDSTDFDGSGHGIAVGWTIRGLRVAMGRFLDWIDELETRAAKRRAGQFPGSAPDIEVDPRGL